MGQILDKLEKKRHQLTEVKFFADKSLSKTQQLYVHYKKTSDSCPIDDTEFTQIFGSYPDIFQILDTDNNLLIDGLQLFTGIALFSKLIRFEDKVEFIFSLFDFNNTNSLPIKNLEFFLSSCCSVSRKLFRIQEDLDDQLISDFLKDQEELKIEEKANISQIIKWAKKSSYIKRFMRIIHSEDGSLFRIQKSETIFSKKLYIQGLKQLFPSNDFLQSKQSSESWFEGTRKLIEDNKSNEDDELSNCQVRANLNWVYGIRSKDVKYFIEIINEQELVYFVGKVAIVLNLKSLKQRFYVGHLNDIICLTTHHEIVATSEKCNSKNDFPQIRVWDSKKMSTIHQIKGLHLNGVHLLKYTKDGTFLITCGTLLHSPVIIYHAQKDYKLFYTIRCDHPTVEISILEGAPFNNHEFVVATLYGVEYFQIIEEKHIQKQKMNNLRSCSPITLNNVYQYGAFSFITCCTFISRNVKFKYLHSYDSQKQKIVLTGHERGEILMWSYPENQILLQLNLTFEDSEQILKIIPSNDHILVCKNSSNLEFWDLDLRKKNLLSSLDITSLQIKLNNYNIHEVLCLSDSYIIITQKGDFFQLDKKKSSKKTFRSQIIGVQHTTRSIDVLFPIEGKISFHCILQKDNQTLLIYGGDQGIIYTINSVTHRMIEKWNIGEEVVSFDCMESRNFGIAMVAGTVNQKVYIRVNFVENNEQIVMEKKIRCLRICPDGNSFTILVGLEGGTICALNHQQSNMSSGNADSKWAITKKKVPGTPMAMVCLDKKILLLENEDNLFYLISLKDYHYREVDDKNPISGSLSSNKPVFEAFYFEKQGRKKQPIVLGLYSKVMVMGRANGRISIWKNWKWIKNKEKADYCWHGSGCSSISINKKQLQMFSSGHSDQMIAVSNLRFFIEQRESLITPPRIKLTPKFERVQSDLIKRQLAYCTFKNDILSKKYDQHLLIRGLQNETLNKLYRGTIEEWKIRNISTSVKKPPNGMMKLAHVFGIETYHTRQSVLSLSSPFRFVYFVSRVIIIYDPKSNKQILFEGHKYRVTCIIKLKQKELMASGESSYHPLIRVWSIDTLETMRVIDTNHRWGIMQLDTMDNYILSYGIYDKEQEINSLQMCDYQEGEIIGHRKVKQSVYSMCINPLDAKQIITTGDNNVTFWRVAKPNIHRVSICEPNTLISCSLCWVFKRNKKKQIEIIVGSQNGDIGIVTSKRRYICLQEKAHSKQITKFTPIYGHEDPTQLQYLISISEDETLKIWNRKLNLIYEQDIRKIEFEENEKLSLGGWKNTEKQSNGNMKNIAVQSISILEEKNEDTTDLLLALRNGNVIVLNIRLPKQEKQEKIDRTSARYTLYLKNHSSQTAIHTDGSENICHKIYFAHHPRFQIIATVAADQNLFYWDTERNMLIKSYPLGYLAKPTAIKFSRDGQLLILGFSDGSLIFLDSNISRAHQGKGEDKFVLPPTLNILKKEKNDGGNSVLNIQVSESGDHLAVSYNNLMKNNHKNEASYIALFINKSREKNKSYHGKMQHQRSFERFSTISGHEAQSDYQTQKNNRYGLAAYCMSFAEYEGKTYLLIFEQLVDAKQNRMNYSKSGNYMVWDVNTSTVIANLDMIRGIIWKKICVPNSIHTKYKIYDSMTMAEETDDETPQNNNLLIPYIASMINTTANIILGSINGDLHLARLRSLEYSNMFNQYPQIEQMFLSKTYPAHCSQISQIEINQSNNTIYTSSKADECILKWQLNEIFTPTHERHNFNEQSSQKQLYEDVFNEIPSQEELSYQLSIYKEKQSLFWRKIIPINFIQHVRLVDVLGRRAFNQRSNLKYDKYGNIIYCSGHVVVNLEMEDQSVDRTASGKTFLYSSSTFAHDISTLEMSKNKQWLAVAYNGLKASISIWQVPSKLQVKQISIQNIVSILCLRMSESNKTLLIYGIDSEKVSYLMVMDVDRETILGICSFLHQPPWTIKDVNFYPGSETKFATCGVDGVYSWELVGQHITYTTIFPPLMEQTQSLVNLVIVITSQEKIITGCDKGTLIVWGNQGYLKQEHNDMILCLTACSENMIISGGKDGYLNIWMESSNNLVVKARINIFKDLNREPSREKNRNDKKGDKKRDEVQFMKEIQSLDFIKVDGNKQLSEQSVKNKKNLRKTQSIENLNFHWKLLVGRLTGDIYQTVMYPEINQNVSFSENIQKIISYQDEQVPQAFFFHQEKYIFQITNKGKLKVRNMQNLKLIYEHNFEQDIVDLVYSAKNQCCLLVLKSEIKIFCLKEDLAKDKEDQKQSQTKLKFYFQKFMSGIEIKSITHVALSANQKMIAVGIQRNSDKNIYIDLYEVKQDKQLKKLLSIPSIQPIQFIDFSKDNKKILIKTYKQLLGRNLQTVQNIREQEIKSIQWNEKGQIFFSLCKQVMDRILQNREMRIKYIMNITDKIFLVIDEHSNVAIFNVNGEILAESVITMTNPSTIRLSQNKKLLGIISSFDRNIVIFDLSLCFKL